MKKKNFNYMLFLVMICLLLMPNNVSAKKKSLGTCNYSVDTEKLSMQNLKSMSFSVTVYDNGSIGKKKVTAKTKKGKEKTYDLASGDAIGGTYYLEQTSAFDKNKAFYKSFKKINNCPDIQLI